MLSFLFFLSFYTHITHYISLLNITETFLVFYEGKLFLYNIIATTRPTIRQQI